MTVAKQIDIRANIKKYFDMAFNGEPVIVPRKENKNVVIISEKDYKELEKARNNAAYLARLDLADEQIRQGKVVVKTMEELEAMAAEWARLLLQRVFSAVFCYIESNNRKESDILFIVYSDNFEICSNSLILSITVIWGVTTTESFDNFDSFLLIK